ncbi:MAG: AAA family ATPase [Acidobacteria bacterium]|nr:AAA family ATPase [Acidobacteriota bacterium]
MATVPGLQQAITNFDRRDAQQKEKLGQEQRQEILKRFPLEGWPTLPVERYALGQADSSDTYCRWVEFKSSELGSVRGGSSAKLILYKRSDKPGWYVAPFAKDEVEGWDLLRGTFVKAFELASREEWAEIEALEPLQYGPALLLKTLHIYFPEHIVPVCSTAHLKHFLGLLGEEPSSFKSLGPVQLNRRLRDVVRARPEFSGWSDGEIMRLVYVWRDPRPGARQIVKIAPGSGARFWEECLAGGYICVGWDAVGDLTEYQDEAAFRARFAELFAEEYKTNPSNIKKKATEVWTLRELKPGDLIVANKGKTQILAVGEVVEPGYEWNTERSDHRHTVRVKWDTSIAREIPPQESWGFVTVAKLPAALYEELIGDGPGPVPEDPLFLELQAALDRKKQVILYGPPGTGKTWVARRFAMSWLARRNGRSDAAALLGDKEKFARAEADLTNSGHLLQLTFHPSYSYEEFVEGFRPVKGESGALSLNLEDGVFKRYAKAAAAKPKDTFLLLIDEINRANIAKVFGELITLIEADKRGIGIVLPQSRDRFVVPPNLFIIGTMNTADRSIRLMDSALRRRFAFVEIMPSATILTGAKVGTLALEDFLEALNRKIASREGREKQIGHAFFLDGTQPVTDVTEFGRRMRYDVLPLLQEYCYDDYARLAEYVGQELVDAEGRLNTQLLDDPESVVRALEKHLLAKSTEE